jgi:hypothetical protein
MHSNRASLERHSCKSTIRLIRIPNHAHKTHSPINAVNGLKDMYIKADYSRNVRKSPIIKPGDDDYIRRSLCDVFVAVRNALRT